MLDEHSREHLIAWLYQGLRELACGDYDRRYTPQDYAAAVLDGLGHFDPVLEAHWLSRFDPNQPRDERGRWTEVGDGESSAFVSPNVGTLTFEQAVAELDSKRQKNLTAISGEIDDRLGISASNHRAIGAWSDGAENALMIVAPGASRDQVRAASAMKGWLADQKQVLVFVPGTGDDELLVNFDVSHGNLAEVHDGLLQDGLAFHTLEPRDDNIRVHVYASDQDTIGAIAKAAQRYDAKVRYVRGTGEFIGTRQDTGSDREQRDDARRVYQQTIEDIADSGRLDGSNLRAIWNDVRDRWQSLSEQEQQEQKALARAWDESQHPRHPPGTSEGGQFAPAGGGDGEGTAPAEPAEPKLDPAVVNVGGDQWNRDTAVRLEREYQAAQPKLDKLATDAVGKSAELAADVGEADADEDEETEEPFVPESWDMLSGGGQQDAEQQYYDKNQESYLQSEIDNYWENSGPDDARDKVAYDFNNGNETEWAEEAIDELIEGRADDGVKPLPVSREQLIEALSFEYDPGHYPWHKGLDIKLDEAKLREAIAETLGLEGQETFPGIEPEDVANRLDNEMRDEINDTLRDALEKESERIIGNMEPPDYLADSAKEYMEESWAQMDDDAKFEWTKSNTEIVENESTGVEKPTPGAPPAGTYTGTIEALPDSYDPLNESSGSNYRRTQAIAKYLSVERTAQVLIERGITPELAGTSKGSEAWNKKLKERIARVDSMLWSSWKSSSTTAHGKLLQLATAEELGGRLNVKTGKERGISIDAASLKNMVNENFSEIGGYDGIKAYVRAKWETTQYLLDQAGMDELQLYRAIDMSGMEEFEKAKAAKEVVRFKTVGGMQAAFEKLPTLHVDRNGAASTSTLDSVPNDWDGKTGRVVLRAVIPRTAAVSVPAYGINVHSEREVVMAGTAWKAWDAWLYEAPRFEQVPMGAKGTGIGDDAPLPKAA